MSTISTKVNRVNPEDQVSTADYVVVAGSEINAIDYTSLAYTIKIAVASVNWKVFGANKSDYSDEVEVLGETLVASGAAGAYAVSITPYAYYRVKIKDGAGHGTATVSGIVKK